MLNLTRALFGLLLVSAPVRGRRPSINLLHGRRGANRGASKLRLVLWMTPILSA